MPEKENSMYYIMTDEEFQEYHRKLKKEKLLDEMMAAASSKSFSAKSARQTNVKSDNTPPLSSERSNITQFQTVQDEPESKMHVSDEEWGRILSNAFETDMSPIKKVTETEMSAFTLDDIDMSDLETSPSTYKNMYKKEQAMLSEILKDTTNQAEIANNILKQMTDGGKRLRSNGGSSVSKLFPDLLSAANSVNQTRRSIVKDMADLKKSAADFELKRLKEENGDAGENVNDTANAFFGQIVGDRKRFIESAMSSAMGVQPQYSEQQTDEYPYEDDNDSGDYQEHPKSNNKSNNNGGLRRFNLTAPLDGYGYDSDDEYDSADPFGYLRNEGRDVSVCVQQYEDGQLEFVALDSDGELVEDYELPDNELLESMLIRPTSNYASDMEGRRYRIIRPSDHVDLSDI